MKRYKAAIVGLGRMGTSIDDESPVPAEYRTPYSHAATYSEIPAIEMVAGCDPDPEARERFRRRYGVERVYASHQEMLANEQVDLLSITTRATERAGIFLDAITAGVRAIYAEKAMCSSLAEADTIVERVRAAGTVVALGTLRNWSEDFLRAKALVEEGRIGKPRLFVARTPGKLSHTDSHTLAVMCMFTGWEPDWVMGHCDSTEAAGDEDLAGTGLFQFKNGMRGAILHGVRPLTFEVYGDKGGIRMEGGGWSWYTMDESVPRYPEVMHRVFPHPNRRIGSTKALVGEILHCLEEGGSPRVSVEQGRQVLEMAIAIRESERRGGVRLSLPLPDRSLTMPSR